jgi:hypothetical protein
LKDDIISLCVQLKEVIRMTLSIAAWPEVKKFELPKVLSKYPTVHPNDQLPVNIINPDIDKGPWIAGGACLKWFQGMPVGKYSDIDVFCKNESQANRLIDFISNDLGLKNHSGHALPLFKTDNATTFSIEANFNHWKLQIITCNYFNSIQEVIDRFDITVCQVATAGNEWILGEKTAKDINQRILRFNKITNASPKRLIKYWTYGYTPETETIEAIQNHADCSWDFINDEEYANSL